MDPGASSSNNDVVVHRTPVRHNGGRIAPTKPKQQSIANNLLRRSQKASEPRCRLEAGLAMLTKGDPDLEHFWQCPDSDNCARCKFAVNKAWWMKKLLWDPSYPERGSWLVSTEGAAGWMLKCHVCSAAGMKGEFATSYTPMNTKLSLFVNHAKSKAHKNAVAITRGLDPQELAKDGAPPASAFADLLSAIRANKANGDAGVVGVGKRAKCRKMKFCLAEARRCEVRDIIRKSECIAIHQDKRDPLLAMRFHSCGSDLRQSKGVLGGADVTKTPMRTTGALGLRDATVMILQDICTPNLGAPGVKKQWEVDGEALCNLFAKIELFDTDAAADETLTGKLLQGVSDGSGSTKPGLEAVLPNLLVCNKDKPHGSRRSDFKI